MGKSPQMDKIHHTKKLKSTKEQVSWPTKWTKSNVKFISSQVGEFGTDESKFLS